MHPKPIQQRKTFTTSDWNNRGMSQKFHDLQLCIVIQPRVLDFNIELGSGSWISWYMDFLKLLKTQSSVNFQAYEVLVAWSQINTCNWFWLVSSCFHNLSGKNRGKNPAILSVYIWAYCMHACANVYSLPYPCSIVRENNFNFPLK